MAGKISGKPVQVGTVVGAGNPVAQVIGGTGAYFEGEVSENAIAKISLGSRVSVKIDALDGRTLPGTVVAINPLGDQVGRIFKARVQIVGDLAGVRPGMFARGSVVLRSYPNVTVVPTEALVERGANDYVFVVEGSKVKLTSVSKGLQKDGVVEVTGVTPGEKIVVSGQTSLDDGTPIRIDESKSDTASTTAGGSAL